MSGTPLYAATITDFWKVPFLSGDVRYGDEAFRVVVNPDLRDERRVTVLETADGRVDAALTPAVADKIGLDRGQDLSESIFRQRLADAGVTLHAADNLFYFAGPERDALSREGDEVGVRRLTEEGDGTVFAEFESSASEQDLDDAYVELDHWAVFGSFEQDRLVTAASMYPWENARIADLGVLTLPPFRGKGHARKVVRAICRYACGLGYEPQYRCQLDNHASSALAQAAGLTLFGKWQVISPDAGQ